MSGPVWSDVGFVSVGDVLVYTARKPGEEHYGQPRDGHTAWLRGGAVGRVVEGPTKGSPPIACPDHYLGIDECTCGSLSKRIPASSAWAVVEWELDDGSTWRRAITRDGLGDTWTRMPVGGES